MNYAGNLSQASLPEDQIIRHIVMPTLAYDSAKRESFNGVQFPFQLAGQSPGLAGIQQDREGQRAKNSFVLLHKYRQHHTLSSSEFIALQARPCRRLTSSSQLVDE